MHPRARVYLSRRGLRLVWLFTNQMDVPNRRTWRMSTTDNKVLQFDPRDTIGHMPADLVSVSRDLGAGFTL